ncbi:hypothetical protein ACK3SF_02990 [Candidatus Nanosalina sp. VS9-1]|uniref:hypothetical protein n=1 Tax=Candidatus Nanosalina sp. VS9-1 TaxID=3388566 RepID=UPI0039E1999D
MSTFLAELVMTSLTVVAPGLYFLLFVEPAEGLKGYRYRFLEENGALESINNAATVGVIGYMIFILSVPALNAFFGTVFSLTVTQAVNSMGTVLQVFTLIILTLLNTTLAYLGLRK